MSSAVLKTIRQRLAQEQGTLYGHGKRNIALVYPSPYNVGMSSLGFQAVYRVLNNLPDTVAERAFMHDEGEPHSMLLTYESQRPVGDFPVVAFSVAYELELPGFFQCLASMGIPALRSERTDKHPWIVVGGPLTFSNPVPLSPFADVVLMGEAENLLGPWVDHVFSGDPRPAVLQRLSEIPGFYVPSIHGDTLLPVAKTHDEDLPAWSPILTPNTVLSNMFLIETERGCSRGCHFCVMRRSTNGGMRVVPKDRILELVPNHAKRVGLVGAAVSDHPKIVDIITDLVDSGREVGLSSLRADRLTPEFVQALHRGGYRTLTFASDGPSERLRAGMEKKIREKHILRATTLAGEAGIPQVKVYMMLGVPDENDADIDELIGFTRQQVEAAAGKTRIAMTISPFVAKRNTPWDKLPFVGIAECERRVDRIRKALQQHIDVRATSSRWAWVEYQLAQGEGDAGLRAYQVWREGGRFSDWKKAFAEPKKVKRYAEQKVC